MFGGFGGCLEGLDGLECLESFGAFAGWQTAALKANRKPLLWPWPGALGACWRTVFGGFGRFGGFGTFASP